MKLIVSVMPRSIEEAQAIDVMRYHDADIIEWRADFLPKEAILQVAPAIFEKFAGRELVSLYVLVLRVVKLSSLQKSMFKLSRKWHSFINQIILILSILATRMFLIRCWTFQISS